MHRCVLSVNSATVTIDRFSSAVATATTVVRVATVRSEAVKIVLSANVATWAIWNCIALKWAAMMALKFVILLALSLTKGDISAVTSVTSLFGTHSTIELPKGMPGEARSTTSYSHPEQADERSCWAMLSRVRTVAASVGGGGERREGGSRIRWRTSWKAAATSVVVSVVEGGRGDGRRFSGERRDGARAPRRDDAVAALRAVMIPRRRRRFGGDVISAPA